jgi:hypothetical protein
MKFNLATVFSAIAFAGVLADAAATPKTKGDFNVAAATCTTVAEAQYRTGPSTRTNLIGTVAAGTVRSIPSTYLPAS